ncbi:MAG: sialate O-acetylesterase [Bacteroidota bacterium]
MKKDLKSFQTITRCLCAVGLNIIFVITLFSQTSQFLVAPLFQDNMVLQQQRDVPVWGRGTPGTAVIIQTSWGEKRSSEVLSDSTWMLKVPTPRAGGPFQISIKHEKSLLVLRNVLAGEVWLCSGQSNMQMPLEGWPPSDTIKNSSNEIEGALYPSIRLFSVMQAYEALPNDKCVGAWMECSPSDVPSFSATAFYFGKMLYNKLKVPIGLINASYGGTSIEAWMSNEGLKPFQEFAESLKKLDQNKNNFRSLTQWISQHPSIILRNQDPLQKWEGLVFGDEHCSARDYNDSAWQTMKLPTLWEQAGIGEFDGAVWFRKQVAIPFAWVGKDLILNLGPVDDMDETYVNGHEVGKHLSAGFWSTNRVYKIDKTLVQDSVLHIAVRVIDYGGGGGIWGNGTKMLVCKDTSSDGVSIEGDWKYLPVAEYRTNTFYVYGAEENEFVRRPKYPIDFSPNTPTSLFNAMINPLVPFAIKGAIWYQGENNVPNPSIYYKLFPAMIADWRKVFLSGDFPFYFVQLAPYNYGPKSQSQLLREAQFQTLSVKNTGMAVTMDIGNPNDIHPTDKENVGKRLALWALAKTYGIKMPFSGPLYKSLKTVKEKIILSFDYAAQGLVLKARSGNYNFVIAGEDKRFQPATVKIDGSRLIISSSAVQKPVAVRYAWGNIEEGTLFNREGLPAPSFRTDDWKE